MIYAKNNNHFSGTDIVNIDSYSVCISSCVSLHNSYFIKDSLSIVIDGIIIEYKTPFLIFR